MLKRLLERSGLKSQLSKLWAADVDETLKPLRKDLRRLSAQVEALHAALEETTRRAQRADRISAQVKLISLLNDSQRDQLAELPHLLNADRVARHVRNAIAAAPLLTEPYEHAVVDQLLPPDVYALLLDAIPPEAFFNDHDPIKRDLRFPMEYGPTLAAAAWEFFDEAIAKCTIRPAVIERFHEPLLRHYDSIFGPAFRQRADSLPQAVTGGRLMLRRPGYHLDPHRDPKHSMLTCLFYLARPGDDEAYGTQIFSVKNDGDASYKQTYYPAQEGRECELVKVVPFKANSMLVFLNSRGAHGATIPADAPVTLERYTYQFYIAPEKDALAALIRELPSDRREMWQSKSNTRFNS